MSFNYGSAIEESSVFTTILVLEINLFEIWKVKLDLPLTSERIGFIGEVLIQRILWTTCVRDGRFLRRDGEYSSIYYFYSMKLRPEYEHSYIFGWMFFIDDIDSVSQPTGAATDPIILVTTCSTELETESEFRYSLENINELTNCISVSVQVVQPNWQ